ncbi:uncharacterized protein DUF4937 [Tumebacillus sp. BK434]|uniref:YdbC family protein n=1 Tax=Tumebacillus sp. BK434 TaxID=2512169 RepID=UPI0010EDDFD2|nr:YdbC family protein [Tumebacillus sp. BK434]TCP54745.1 uncharacterized protein DUF4937 [Tumebacillus sp. BK434]
MLIKWMVCQVEPKQQAAFSQAQETWSQLRGAEGFCGQLGGWKTDAGLEAHIAGLWCDRAAYQSFMEDAHDRIIGGSGQSNTYTSICVTLEEVPDADVAGRLQAWQQRLQNVAAWTVVPGDEKWDTLLHLGSH